MAPTPPEPGRDYYVLPDGRWVFTARYLKARGSCCRSGCRDCPYGYGRGGVPADTAAGAMAPTLGPVQRDDSNAPM